MAGAVTMATSTRRESLVALLRDIARVLSNAWHCGCHNSALERSFDNTLTTVNVVGQLTAWRPLGDCRGRGLFDISFWKLSETRNEDF
jgi:hypothetical protein